MCDRAVLPNRAINYPVVAGRLDRRMMGWARTESALLALIAMVVHERIVQVPHQKPLIFTIHVLVRRTAISEIRQVGCSSSGRCDWPHWRYDPWIAHHANLVGWPGVRQDAVHEYETVAADQIIL
jgi:hypothetical protein